MDPAEESWSIVLPYGINQTTNMVELRPSILTGLLMKRKGAKGEDGHTSIEVSLFSSIQPTPSTEEPWTDELLEDIIKQYRGLVTLSVTRGCIDPNVDCLPWHVATAIRGARVLGDVM
jgi:mediator of RNA polymerase II transcription subunit 13